MVQDEGGGGQDDDFVVQDVVAGDEDGEVEVGGYEEEGEDLGGKKMTARLWSWTRSRGIGLGYTFGQCSARGQSMD